jgi:hypothetical protein
MSETIKCEITNVKMFDNRASVSIKAMGELPTDLENSKSYSDQYGLQYSQFLNDGDLPPYVKVGTKIAIPYYVNKNGYMALSQYDEVKVLEEANVVDEIKQAFPNATVETIKSDDDKATDFPYGANEKKPNGKDKLNGHSGLNKDKLEFATQYLTEYESIGKIFKPDFNLVKLDERNYKDVITGCKIAMTQKFGN